MPPRPAGGDDGLRGVEIKGPVDAVAAARLELLAITQCRGTPAPLGGDGQRFRYASTVVSARGDDRRSCEGGDAAGALGTRPFVAVRLTSGVAAAGSAFRSSSGPGSEGWTRDMWRSGSSREPPRPNLRIRRFYVS